MFVAGGRVAAVTQTPGSDHSPSRCQELLDSCYGTNKCIQEDLEMSRLVISWFRRHPHELAKAIRERVAATG